MTLYRIIITFWSRTAGCHVNSLRDRMYNKKALLFDMEVGYQSELKWNLSGYSRQEVVSLFVPFTL